VVDPSAPSYTAAAEAIVAELPPRRYRITELASDATAELAALRDRRVTVVAVGAAAVTAARTELPGKDLVFCQVLAPEALLGQGERVWGVHALPPLAVQLRSWRAVDPTLRTVALIVSDRDAALAREAAEAARANATDLLIETSTSDRETLYLFRRLAAEVDGLWLLPDHTALSPSALRELLSYASARRIGVLAFSDALLTRGALLSATSLPQDVAAAVHDVVERVVTGKTADLPAVTPLSAVALEVNAAVARELGLPAPAATRWVTREPD
jgi:putative ABC transport system substrate-binding protein